MIKSDKKKQFRNASLKILKKNKNFKLYYTNKVVVNALYNMIIEENGKQIMLYLPLKMEINIYPLINCLRKEGKLIFVPFMEEDSFRLVKYRLPLLKKKFGIKEPKYSNQYRRKKIDLSIVPIVGVDSTFRRIGFGKGMYDRFFEKERKNINKIVFVARKLCYSKEIVTDDYDVEADIVITP